jgi:hypothetical protein
MRLWWLSFKGGTAAILRAEALVHARLLAAADKVARAYLFDAGFQVDSEFEQMIPDANECCNVGIVSPADSTSASRSPRTETSAHPAGGSYVHNTMSPCEWKGV